MKMMNKKTAKLMVLTMLLSFATTVKAENTISSVVSFKATASKDSFKKTVETDNVNNIKSSTEINYKSKVYHSKENGINLNTGKNIPIDNKISETNFFWTNS